MKPKSKLFGIATVIGALIVVVALISLMSAPSLLAEPSQKNIGANSIVRNGREIDLSQVEEMQAHLVDTKGEKASEPALYIILLEAPPLASYRGGIDGLAPTSAAVQGQGKLDVDSAASVAYLAYLDQQRALAIDGVSQALGRTIDVAYEYKAALNGFSAEMTPAEAAQVARLSGIKLVEREQEYELQTDAGPAWMGAPGIWNGTDTGGLPGTEGEGVVVGVIDTGIDPWNPSFADVGDDGYDHTNPKGQFYGVCDPTNTDPPAGVSPYDPTFPCNDKLIGAWGYDGVNEGDPRDSNGHGSHTASTAAGNVVNGAIIAPPTGITFSADISGVAPHANIIAYAACCTSPALAAAIDQVVLDEVDVVNYSIGSNDPTPDPWSSANAVAWLAAREAGIFVATSNGNNGPGDETTGSPSDLPWLTAVGANSHNRAFPNNLEIDDGNGGVTIEGQGISPGYGPAPIVYSIDYADVLTATEDDVRLCAPGAFPAGTFDGEIVVCERGTYGRVAKGQSVKDGGAGGYILAQPEEVGGGPGAVANDTHVLPGLHIDYFEYQDLKAVVTASGMFSGTITGAVKDVDDAYGDIMAAFSSRGANRGVMRDYIVPNVTAPGRAIWAAYHQGEGGDGDYTFNVIQGTSMSSPHVAGAGALMKALHPSWTPAQIESALMTTSRNNILDDDGQTIATPFAQGSGHVDLTKAGRAGFVLDVTAVEFQAANPATGGSVKALNLSSMGDSKCLGDCSWTRVLSSTQPTTVTWTASVTGTMGLTVEPSSFDLPAGGTQMVTVTADVTGLPVEEWVFGTVTLTPSDGDISEGHFPVAALPVTGILPDQLEIPAQRNAGSVPVEDLEAIEITDLAVDIAGLTQADIINFELFEDPTNTIPQGFYDDLDQVFWMTTTVPADTHAIYAEIVDTTSPDLDMAVGFDMNGDGLPEESEQVCQSATATAFEFCEVLAPQAGTWWVVVLNWEESANAPDPISLALAVVPDSDSGNMTVTGPDSVPAGELFDLRVYWDTPEMEVGDRWYGALKLGSEPGNPGDIGTIPVFITRYPDDVSKAAEQSSSIASEQVLTYTITVQPNMLPEDVGYVLTDTIPAGLTYVPGSASASRGTVTVDGNQLVWTGVMEVPEQNYFITTNAEDPTCDTPLGGYVDAETAFEFTTDPGLSGDTIAWSYGSQAGTDFYGLERAASPLHTDDGIVVFGEYAGSPWMNQDIPDAAPPNGLFASYWRDMEIVYDEATNSGVTAVTFGGGVLWMVEFDNIQEFDNSSNNLDFEVFAWNDADPTLGVYDAYYAFDNVNISDMVGTIGVENDAGDEAVQFAYDDFTPTDGLVVCVDWATTAVPAEITYAVTVDAYDLADLPASITNTVVHDTDTPGSNEESTSATISLGLEYYFPAIFRSE